MKLLVYVDPAAAVRAGKTVSGRHVVSLSADDLALMGPAGRDRMSDLPGLGGEETASPILGQGRQGLFGTTHTTEQVRLAEPTAEAVVAAVKELVRIEDVERAVKKARDAAALDDAERKLAHGMRASN